jgi:hypothetical protein
MKSEKTNRIAATEQREIRTLFEQILEVPDLSNTTV